MLKYDEKGHDLSLKNQVTQTEVVIIERSNFFLSCRPSKFVSPKKPHNGIVPLGGTSYLNHGHAWNLPLRIRVPFCSIPANLN